jgi:exopolysaccharide production protein ExoQ
MPSRLALLLCFIFILVLFKVDRGKKSDTSAALWLPTIWVLIISSRMVGEWLSLGQAGQSADSYADGSPVDRNIFLVLILSALVIVAKRHVSITKVLHHNRWLCLYLVYCGISVVWSDFPVVSLKRYVKEIGNLLMVLIVWTERMPLEAIRALMKRCAYVLIPLSIVMFKYFPEFGRSYSRWTGDLSFTGVTNNKNSLGILCAISGLGLAWSLLQIWHQKHVWVTKKGAFVQGLLFLMTMWTLVEAHSATSIACFVVGVCILTLTRVNAIRRHIAFWIIAAIVVASSMFLLGNLVSTTTQLLGRDETLTGRTDVWKTALEMGTNPIVGDGYSSFWLGERLGKMWSVYSWRPTEAHSGYVETYLDLGVIGVLLLSAVIISAFRPAVAMLRRDFDQGVLRLAILTMAVLYNITESSFRPGLLMYFLFILAVVHLPRSLKNTTPVRASFPGYAALGNDDRSVVQAIDAAH